MVHYGELFLIALRQAFGVAKRLGAELAVDGGEEGLSHIQRGDWVEHRILHDRLVVVGAADEPFFNVELVLPVGFDVFPVDADVLVAVGTRLFMRHTEHVAELVHRRRYGVALVGLEVDGQPSKRAPHD